MFSAFAVIAVIIGVMNNFFVSHYVFRWRTAMNEHYMAHWHHLRPSKVPISVCRKIPCALPLPLEDMGVSFINAVMTLIAFLPVLVTLSERTCRICRLGHLPYGWVGLQRWCGH